MYQLKSRGTEECQADLKGRGKGCKKNINIKFQ